MKRITSQKRMTEASQRDNSQQSLGRQFRINVDEKFDHRYNTRRASIVKENKFNEGRDLLDIF